MPTDLAKMLRLLARSEIPECACPLEWEQLCDCPGPCECPRRLKLCEHVWDSRLKDAVFDFPIRAQPGFTVLQTWAACLQASQDEEYAVRPLPACPSSVMRKEARIRVYAERQARGEHLYHPADVGRRCVFDDAAYAGHRGANGAVYEGELRERQVS